MNIIAKELSVVHIGKRITVPFEGQRVTGTLTNVIHDADIISNMALCSAEPTYELGRQWVYIQIAGNFEDGETIQTRLQPDTPITIQEGE